MKILIIDDNPRRYSELATQLNNLGLTRDDYKIVDCVNTAEDLVKSNYYDLIILDILIPYYNYGEADKQVSLDFFDYLHSDECTHKPEKIIGITSDISILENTQSKFQAFTWHIIKYSDSDHAWLETLLPYINYVFRKNQHTQNNYYHDVLIVNALLDPELLAILDLPWNWEKIVISDDGLLINSGNLMLENKNVKIAAIHTTEMGMVPTAILTTQLLQLLKPKVVCMTGICAGNSTEVKLGDIIVASTSWDHQSGKRELFEDKIVFKFSPIYISLQDCIKRDFQNLIRDTAFENLKKEIKGISYSPELRIGPMASSSTVLADSKTLEAIVNDQHRKLMGIDMEVFGLYSACHYHSDKVHYFAVKGVCDFADTQKNDDFQKYAAENSAFTLNLYFQKNLLKLLR